jgi:hypothetical protein
MRLHNRHIVSFGRLFLALFFLANSGFTVVLYHCAMTDEMCGVSCCVGIDCRTAASCEDIAGRQAPVAQRMSVYRPCQTAIVAGGYQAEPTVLEKQFSGERIIKSDLLPASVLETAFGDPVDLPVFHLASASSNVSPLSVETYILNSSFLI